MNTLRLLFDRFRQFFQFGLVGILNTVVDFVVFSIANLVIGLFTVNNDAFIYIFIANALGVLAGVTNSYFINRNWTFKQKNKASGKEALKFYFVNLISFLVSTIVIYLLCNFVFPPTMPFYEHHEIIAKLFAAPLVIIINFIGSKYFAFKE